MHVEPIIQSPDQPLANDILGNRVYVYDLVKVIKIPDFYFTEDVDKNDPLFEIYRSYIGCYGFVRYDENIKSDNRIIWIDSNSAFCVDVIKCENDLINVYDFLLYPDCIERMEPNFLIYSIFANYNFPMHRDQYKSLGDVNSVMGFNMIESIIRMPKEKLMSAHKKLLEAIPDLFG